MKNKIKYIGIILLVLAMAINAAIFIFRARIITYYLPAIEQIGVIDIKVKNDTSYINSKLLIRNKTFLKINIDTFKYKVSLFNKTYLQSQKFIGKILHGHRSDTLDVSIKIPYLAILKDLREQRIKGDSTSYSISLSIQYSTVIGRVEIPISKTSKLKIPQPPDFEVVDIIYKKVRMKSIHADVKIKITNYSAVSLSIKEMSYYISILKQGNVLGTVCRQTNLHHS